jgi:hypothetical protein
MAGELLLTACSYLSWHEGRASARIGALLRESRVQLRGVN